MLVELTQRYQNMYKLVTERITALGDYTKKVEEARKIAAETEAALVKVHALQLAIDQLQLLREEIDDQVMAIKSSRSEIEKFVKWARPIENGKGYPSQTPGVAWDGFQALLDLCDAEVRKQIRALPVEDDERTADNFVHPSKKATSDAPPSAKTFAKLHAWMIQKTFYPKQAQPLHNKFSDDVLPKIEKAVHASVDAQQKQLDDLFDAKMGVIGALTQAAGSNIPPPKSGGPG